ncbi:DUF4363 family protein [Paenalkalicoccus suaedae]|uniref:DUF4363 family protein n=1 Tax=Paenalkalicoccus suaedae TaxID=2592382 RepID=A0A859FBP1_9BACI|nr:DUF4363 family protein [Paenalkalicoccus suaedae]QKS69954.1 DUF4363 family protein [Paenalkalicoccus suaedae]
MNTRKILLYLIPTAFVIISLVIMTSGSWLKHSFTDSDDVSGYLSATSSFVVSEEWSEAVRNAEQLDSAWHEVLARIQYSVERDDLATITETIARVQGAIAAEDRASAMIEISLLERLWEDVG